MFLAVRLGLWLIFFYFFFLRRGEKYHRSKVSVSSHHYLHIKPHTINISLPVFTVDWGSVSEVSPLQFVFFFTSHTFFE